MADKDCPHNVIRKKRTEDPHQYHCQMYVCGSCATLFEVKIYEEPKPAPREQMFDRRPPWGMRSRQA